jgi:hypothetical protein
MGSNLRRETAGVLQGAPAVLIRDLDGSVQACADPKPFDLVLHLQLAALQLGNLQVVAGRMTHRLGDFVFERPVPPFKIRKTGLDGHVGWLLEAV